MDLDPNNPNLDGDYKAFLKVEEQRKDESDLPTSKDTILNFPLQRQSTATTTTDISVSVDNLRGQNEEPSQEIVELRNTLFQATKSGNISKCRTTVAEIEKKYHISLADSQMRESDKTVLHRSLELDMREVSMFYIGLKDIDLLTATFPVKTGETVTQKTCLHLLVESTDTNLLETFLNLLKSFPNKSAFMEKTIMKDMKGQRPRHLAAIHMAALEGKDDVIDLLHKHDQHCINFKNNKKDTPVLWAARWNHIQTVKHLMKLGADPNVANDKGSTALYWAVRYGYPELTAILLDNAKSEEEKKSMVNFRRHLGFEVPVILASALGFHEILTVLLKNGADPNATRAGGSTALHMAASLGRIKIVNVLLDFNANREAEDDLGNTPLLIAIKNHKLLVAKELLANGANIHTANKLGQGIWDLAIVSPDQKLLETLLTMYKHLHARRGSQVSTFRFEQGRSPIHAAAKRGDVEKLRVMLSMGVSPSERDFNGNTFLHIAARNNSIEVLNAFIDNFDVDAVNHQGDTPIHLACHEGNEEAVEILLNKSSLNKTNKMKETVLHKCTHSESCSPALLEMLVDAIVKTQSWGVIDAKDEHGDTALHIAARNGRTDLIPVLSHLNPKLLNDDGNTPMHVSAELGDGTLLKLMLSQFCNPLKGFNIDMPRRDGETLLHICARQGNSALVELLIQSGADLSKQDEGGNTVLHDLAQQITSDPLMSAPIKEVFELIIDNAAWWWCNSHMEQPPDKGSSIYIQKSQEAVRFLLEDITNCDEYNVIEYTIAMGAIDLLNSIFSLEDIYVLCSKTEYRYDVTNISPETTHFPDEKVSKTRKNSRLNRKQGVVVPASVSELNNNDDKETSASKERDISYLDHIFQMEDMVLATSILDVSPFNFLVGDYWTFYRFLYLILMAVHILNMSLFTAYAIPLSKEVWKKNGTNDDFNVDMRNGCFVIWPVIILLFAIFYFISDSVAMCKQKNNKKCCESPSSAATTLLYSVSETIMSYLGFLTANCFGILVIVWFALYQSKNRDQVYVLAAALVVGWLYGITFTKGFQSVHSFSIMLKIIILRDISRFLLIYAFILLGFGFAIHALFQVSSLYSEDFPTPGHTLFLSFDMMIGMEDIFESQTDADQSYSSVGSTSVYLRIVYLIYIIMSTVILLNLLIAMMSDTYNDIKSKEGTTWRISSLSMAVKIEKYVPALAHSFKYLRNWQSEHKVQFDEAKKRYYITIPIENVQVDTTKTESETKQAMTKLESRVNFVSHQFNDLNRKMDAILELVCRSDAENRVHSPRPGTAAPGARPSVAHRKLSRKVALTRKTTKH